MATRMTPDSHRLSRRSLIVGLGVGAGMMGLTACAPSTEDGQDVGRDNSVTLRMALADNAQSNYYRGAQAIADGVALATSGQVTIKVVAGGALGDERSTVEMVQNNDLDIASAANTVVSNWITEMRILDQAFLWDTVEQAHAAVDGEIGELIHQAALPKRMRVIGYMESGFRNIISTRPVAKLSDLNALKIRTMQNTEQIKAFDWLGAIPVAMPAGDQFTALQQGTIDAVENATANAFANRYDEVSKDITETAHTFVYIMLVMSDKAWEKIPEHLHEPFLEAVTRGCHQQRNFLDEANKQAKTDLSQNGVKFHEINRQPLIEAVEARRSDEATTFDPVWQEAVDRVRSASGSHEGGK